MNLKNILVFFTILTPLFFTNCSKDDEGNNDFVPGTIQINQIRVGATELDLNNSNNNQGIPVDGLIEIEFSVPIDASTISSSIEVLHQEENQSFEFVVLDLGSTVSIQLDEGLEHGATYTIKITSDLLGAQGEKFPGYEVSFTTEFGLLEIVSVKFNDVPADLNSRILDLPFDLVISVEFSHPVDPASIQSNTIRLLDPIITPIELSFSEDFKTIIITPNEPLKDLRRYRVIINDALEGQGNFNFETETIFFYTTFDENPKFPVLGEEDFLTLIQEQTFKYFWDFGHPVSGLARERNSSGNLVTSGGSGFGIMAMIVGVERGFITRNEAVDRLSTIVDFLENAERFHGAWSHWLNGTTGATILFSTFDNGGDLVETSFMIQGLLTWRQYLNEGVLLEAELIGKINALWESVEWTWYTRGGQNVLFWHWSPNHEWQMNMQIRGYHEALITYILAASSPTFPIDPQVYHQGWARNGGIVNGNEYYDINLPLGTSFGGPLFFAHYSFLGLDPRGLSDQYADYMEQNVNHSLINRAHSIANPNNYAGYYPQSWGLTASDNHSGYSAHSPTNDLGVITPTAAISSMPFTPEESLEAAKFFYYNMGDRLWGDYGFYDAFNITEGWIANSYLAIDQGPIIVMIENHRTGLLWDLFMSCPEIQEGLAELGFSSPHLN